MAMYSSEQPLLPQATPRRPGEGPARRTRIRALVFMVVALGAGLLAALMITRYVAHRPDRLAEAPIVKVAVAAINLSTGAALNKDAVEFVDWPKTVLPQGTFSDLAALEGRVTNGPVIKGEPVLMARLAPVGARQGMAAVIPENMRAMTVPVNEVVGVAGFIHPGDFVDVLTTMPTPINGRSGDQEFRSKVVLQNIKVLAVGEDLMADESKPVKVPVVTLLVTPEQSERLALSSTQGKLQLTMRAQRDQSEVDTGGVSPPELLGSAVAAAAPATSTSTHHHSSHGKPAAPVAAAPAPKKDEVIEVLRGDGFEERKLRAKDNQ
ncbi:MAG TPA: Flp pilus assembly protein CpaB [Polyangia bacterium]